MKLKSKKHKPAKSPLNPVFVTYIATRGVWVLLDEYPLTPSLRGMPDLGLSIPEGFEFDLASIPRILWSQIASFELSIVAPLVHDWLYGPGEKEILRAGGEVDRKTADRIFYDLMIQEGVPKAKARVAYLAVRWFGPRW